MGPNTEQPPQPEGSPFASENQAQTTPPRPGTLGRDPAPSRGPDGLLREDFRVPAPSVSLPKGGGAIAGIGEKVSANPVSGSASGSLPLPLTPGRGGFTPGLSLTYDSGARNGPFGLGWRLTLPSVRRKTDKGLPRYLDEQDTFILSETEDLVPLLEEAGGDWQPVTRSAGDSADPWTVQRFRPRVEGAFARIERWKRDLDGRTYWRTISRENVKRIYGRSDQARLTDPDDSSRVFEWLLEEEADERGNVISYQYAAEDRAGLATDSPDPAEARRSVAYRYPKRVSYGNSEMWENPDDGGVGSFRFHLVFDYGDHDDTDPGLAPSQTWNARLDRFSNFRPRFDVRCYRLCRRVLMLHDFSSVRADAAGDSVPAVVRALKLYYEERSTISTLAKAQVEGWAWTGTSYETESLPELTLTYTEPKLDSTIRHAEGLSDLPAGSSMRAWQFVDLDGEGLSGMLTEQGDAWFYKRSEGQGSFARPRCLGRRPNVALAEQGVRLTDLNGDGCLDLVVSRAGHAGFQARREERWESFRPFESVPTHRVDDPDSRLVDLDGDGHADLLVTEGNYLVWYPSRARKGYGEATRIQLPHNENEGPRFLFSRDGAEFFLADMSGDGLSDVVRIRNGSISYWPNVGYGQFGSRVHMSSAPRFDHSDRYDPSRIRLGDLDGSGPTDLLYVGPSGVRLWFNHSGNGWSEPTELGNFSASARPHDVQLADLTGDGTQCLVWFAQYLREEGRPLHYMKLMSEGKPWLLSHVNNGLGKETTFDYTPSTAFYLADRRAGRPWATRLPFPVQCLSKVTAFDRITGWRFVNRYAYHHGYFDGVEREFRGFGMVEQWDAETVSDYDQIGSGELVVQLPPVRSRTWFHTGAWAEEQSLAEAFEEEHATADPKAHRLRQPSVPPSLDPRELREAHRALKGRMLRQEVYAEDESGHLQTLYTVSEQTFSVARLQPDDGERPGSFRVDALESLSYVYDLDLRSGAPDPRVSHELVLETDDYGNVLRSAAVSYPRRGSGHDSEQESLTTVVTESGFADPGTGDDVWHVGVPTRTKVWELTDGPAWSDDTSPATTVDMDNAFGNATAWSLEDKPSGPGPHKRLIGHEIRTYWNDDLSGPLEPGLLGMRALVYQSYALAFTNGLVSQLFGSRLGTNELLSGGYVDLDADGDGASEGDAWIPSGILSFDPELSPPGFYQPIRHSDPFGNETSSTWDYDRLAVIKVVAPSDLTVEAAIDYRLMVPSKVTDPNGTESKVELFDPLGRVREGAVRNGSEGDKADEHSSEFKYDTLSLPASVHVRLREEHGGDDWQESWAYSDGSGNVVQTKARVAPGEAPVVSGDDVHWVDSDPRFVGTGRTVVDNKGNVVKQYEPFFSTTSDYEDERRLVEWGKAVVYDYDPVGRNTKVTLPDKNIRTWEYDPWIVVFKDEEDNRVGGKHENTPTVTHLDHMGRVYKSLETPGGGAWFTTHLELNVQGSVVKVTDPRGNEAQVQRFDAVGRAAFTGAADEGYDGSSGNGESLVLIDVGGQPLHSWKSGGLEFVHTYDELRRPTGWIVNEGAGDRLVQRTFYGDALTGSTEFSQGLPVRVYDTAGEIRLDYDFRGRASEETRTVIDDITVEADWTGLETMETVADLDAWVFANGGLSTERFQVTSQHDALGRAVEQKAPDGSRTKLSYDEGGHLKAVTVFVRGAASATQFVEEITYNADGQRKQIAYGNHCSTRYTYDPDRFWLNTVATRRSATSPHGAATLQELSYERDSVGNIEEIADAAQETLFFANAQVSPVRTFEYDSLYRLETATGREKVNQKQTTAHYSDYAGSLGAIPDAGTPALRRYSQSYRYDEAGNILEMMHQEGSATGAVAWRRGYAHQTWSNQLLSTSALGDLPDDPSTHSQRYHHNERGAMVFLPHLKSGVTANLTRDFRDHIRKADLDLAGNVAWYSYDAAGRRVRKTWIKNNQVEERVYVAGYEVWRKRTGAGAVSEERQTLHVMDSERRIAMTETLTVSGGSSRSSPTPRLRYQLDDHLGTVLVELDHGGGSLSYEEYHPYGTAAWWAEKGHLEVAQRRYQYGGKERDEETGLCYHRLRFYMPWLGRWERTDPIGLGDGVNPYLFARGSPTVFADSYGDQARPLLRGDGRSGSGRSAEEAANDDSGPEGGKGAEAVNSDPLIEDIRREAQGLAVLLPGVAGADAVERLDRLTALLSKEEERIKVLALSDAPAEADRDSQVTEAINYSILRGFVNKLVIRIEGNDISLKGLTPIVRQQLEASTIKEVVTPTGETTLQEAWHVVDRRLRSAPLSTNTVLRDAERYLNARGSFVGTYRPLALSQPLYDLLKTYSPELVTTSGEPSPAGGWLYTLAGVADRDVDVYSGVRRTRTLPPLALERPLEVYQEVYQEAAIQKRFGL